MRRAAHRDANEEPIVRTLRAVGAFVQPLSAPNVPDLLVGYRGQTYLLEVKEPAQVRTHKRIRSDGSPQTSTSAPEEPTDGQRKWHAAWRGTPVRVVRTPEEALAAIGVRHG